MVGGRFFGFVGGLVFIVGVLGGRWSIFFIFTGRWSVLFSRLVNGRCLTQYMVGGRSVSWSVVGSFVPRRYMIYNTKNGNQIFRLNNRDIKKKNWDLIRK